MKITKQKLRQIILEEMGELGQDKLSASDAKVSGLETGKAQSASGVTSQERGLIKQLSDMLVSGAEEGNLLSGTVVLKIKQLAAELQKIQKAPPQGEQQ